MRDTVNTNKKFHAFNYPLLFMDIFWHFEIDFLGKEKFTTTSFDIIDGDTTSRRRFEYSKTEKRWIARSGLSRLEDFGYICTKPNCCSGKVVADEKEDEDDEEETEGSGKEYDD